MSDRAELFRALGALAEPPAPGQPAIADALGITGEASAADYAEVFLFNAYPYASVYVGSEGMLGGEARDRVAGFWRALGFTPPPEPDHVSALLGLYGTLVEAEAAAARDGSAARGEMRRRSRKALLWEHLLSWLTAYLDKVRELAPPFYAGWAGVLAHALAIEALELGPAERLPLHLRVAPGLPEPDAGATEWVAALIAPIRTGVLLTRRDLQRGATALGLGSRVGERAFVLRSMLEQDGPATVGWLADEAATAGRRHARSETSIGAVAAFWRGRAEACEAALREMRPANREVVLSHGS